MKTVAISQPRYLPAINYLDRIVRADVFVLLDTCQHQPRAFEHRNRVLALALAFLLLVGMALVADGLDHHIPKGYIYFAMGFSVLVEMLNLRLKRVAKTPVRLHEPYIEESSN